MEIIAFIIAAAIGGFVVGLLVKRGLVSSLRAAVASKDRIICAKNDVIRDQGREIADHRAAEQRRQAQRVAASRKAVEAGKARRAAKGTKPASSKAKKRGTAQALPANAGRKAASK